MLKVINEKGRDEFFSLLNKQNANFIIIDNNKVSNINDLSIYKDIYTLKKQSVIYIFDNIVINKKNLGAIDRIISAKNCCAYFITTSLETIPPSVLKKCEYKKEDFQLSKKYLFMQIISTVLKNKDKCFAYDVSKDMWLPILITYINKWCNNQSLLVDLQKASRFINNGSFQVDEDYIRKFVLKSIPENVNFTPSFGRKKQKENEEEMKDFGIRFHKSLRETKLLYPAYSEIQKQKELNKSQGLLNF